MKASLWGEEFKVRPNSRLLSPVSKNMLSFEMGMYLLSPGDWENGARAIAIAYNEFWKSLGQS